MIELVALSALLVIVYAYFLFPVLVCVRGWLLHRPWHVDNVTPPVSIVIICHNESAHIEEKLQNVLSQDYPANAIEVIVASDGSDDGTDEILEAYPDERVVFLACPRRGKIPALNEAVAIARGEILVFSDANSMFLSDALLNLTRHFADPSIGCVAGNQVYSGKSDRGAAAPGERSYWTFDRFLKVAESRAGNTISATGAIYAIRRELFQDVPSGVTDDFTVSTRVIRQGCRIVFDPDAIAQESVAGEPRAEFRRKVRVMTRGFRAVFEVRDLLNPFRYGFYSLQLFSHKILRRLVVLPLLVLFCLSPWLWSAGLWFQALVTLQLAVYGLALTGWIVSGTRLGCWRPFAIPLYFCLVNCAALVALINVICGRRIERWESGRQAVMPEQTPSLIETRSP